MLNQRKRLSGSTAPGRRYGAKTLAFTVAMIAAAVCCLPSAARADAVVIPTAVGDVLKGQGTGLCIAQAISQAPKTLNLNTIQIKDAFNGEINSFMEAHAKDRVESVLRTLFDLSNNNSGGMMVSYGDFTSAVDTCKIGGCPFLVNDTSTSFGLRARGFLNVTPDLAGKNIHFGFYTDDAVSLTFYGKSGMVFPVITRPAEIGNPTWRVTNTVSFSQPGLYPFEVLYIEIDEEAALEMSYFVDDNFVDFERPAKQAPVVKLKGAGFQLFPPEMFSQTISGQQSFPDINACKQCDRQFVNAPGNGGCDLGFYCNEAALCAPCDSAAVCGPSCSPCQGNTPFCKNVNGQFSCVQCEADAQCQPGCKCDLMTNACVCHECEQDKDCPKGKTCQDNKCAPCSDGNQCAGNSCNCCPPAPDGKQTTCAALEMGGTPLCVECTSDADCGNQKCDLKVGRCMDTLFQHEDPTDCGDQGAKCPPEAPFCLPSHFGTACAQCRADSDCGDGKYCRSGHCDLCLEDKRCGKRCQSCGGDTPFCLGSQVPENAACVRCETNAQCNGAECDPKTHTCNGGCAATCAVATPYCYGDKCVECYADTQCPCGGTCNPNTNSCTTSCNNNGDCSSTDHCKWADNGQTKVCTLGQMPDDVGCGSTLGNICQKSTIGSPVDDPIPLTGAVVVSGLLLAARRRRRREDQGRSA